MSADSWGLTLLGAALGLPAALYAGVLLTLRRHWQRLPVVPITGPADAPLPAATPTVSVLIAARNEADTLPLLLADLNQQQGLAPGYFEVLVADDHSTDATAEAVRQFAARSAYPLRVVSLAELPDPATGKKAAVAAALATATTPWVLLTDADCRVPPHWLAAYAAPMAEPTVQFISGPVLLEGRGLLAELQGLELAALVGVGAACIAAGAPTMCNGANLAYRRSAFAAVAGFAGNAHVPSGDDEFLLHKLAALYPQGIRFLKHPAAVVRTEAQPTLPALLNQRVRWASKWQHYQTAAPRRLALLVLGANLVLALLPLLALAWPALWPWAAAAWLLKLGADALFLSPVLGFFARRRWLWLVPLLQLVYPLYALATGLLGLRGGYRWKGRRTR
ncbi:glycosyltransferase [Hymenobacter busanensis]|uniref:Glycosyltransferase n=1 Tax=Hymenobacter busanensis TaxID=2607656 RepID=A0A7L4ZV99_9BACT|nr:glycosyltransferase [Hymenobacter busanensis]KAA9339346.1 glycosyltransferase [Hymenobacter busanensis]QHJ06893.1 glycosyltransferase [Hymenobacter busanensis]